MNIDQLKSFCTVAETLSFTESSRILAISQPAVSRQIATLENEIGAKLFKRSNNALTLTQAGSMLYEELPQRLMELEKIFFDARLIDLGKIRRIKIGVLRDQCPDSMFLDVCRSMRQDNYYVRIEQYDFQGLETAVIQRDVDVAVSIQWILGAFSGCSKMIYMQEPLCLAVNTEFSPEIPSEMNRDTLKEFSKERPTIIPEAGCFSKGQYQEIAKVTSQFWQGVTEEALDLVIPMVQAGIGSALVNINHILSCDPSVFMQTITFLDPVNKGVFWLKENPNDAVRDFVDRMKNHTAL